MCILNYHHFKWDEKRPILKNGLFWGLLFACSIDCIEVFSSSFPLKAVALIFSAIYLLLKFDALNFTNRKNPLKLLYLLFSYCNRSFIVLTYIFLVAFETLLSEIM